MKKLLRKWLGIDDLIQAEMTRLASMDNKLLEIRKLLNVGIDFHSMEKYSGSWAVVCIKGKPEYVNFINLSHKNAQEIRHIFRSFIRNSITIDNPFLHEYFSDGRF